MNSLNRLFVPFAPILIGLIGAQHAALQADPDLRRFSWTETHAPSYSPFLLLAAADPKGESCSVQDIEAQYGPALTALVDLWRSEWALPLELSPAAPGSRAALAFLPSFAVHKEIAAKKFPEDDTIPASYLLGEVGVTYLYGNAFESKGARRGAVLHRAAERLLALHQPEAGSKSLAAWLHGGLSIYLGEIREKGEGKEGSYFAREESPYWRDSLARAAEELKELKLSPPSLDEILKIGSEAEMQSKPRCYREFVRLSGYSLIAFSRARATERFAKPFSAYLKDEFRGEGGPERFRTQLQQFTGPFTKEWQAFCRPGAPAPEPTASAPPNSPGPGPVPAKRAGPSAGTLSPVALDMTPRTLVDLRAEVLRKVRSLRFDEALHEVYDVREKQSDLLKPHLAAEKRMLEAVLLIYETFGKNCKPGDKLSAAFGHAGEIVRCHPDGSFEIREKSRTNRYPWTALSLQAVAAHTYGSLRRNGPEETLDHATALLLCGNLEAAKEAIKTALTNGASAQRAEWLRKMVPDFERALKEAKARDTLEEIASLDLTHAVERLRRKLLDSDVRASVAREYAKPFLEGMLSVHFGAEFENRGLASLFRGKLQKTGESFLLSYVFDDEAELADWEPAERPALVKLFDTKTAGASAWSCVEGKLRIATSGARRHAASWAGDLVVTVAFEARERTGAKENVAPAFVVGILDDGKGGFACNEGAGGIRRFYEDGRFSRDGAGDPANPPKWETGVIRRIKMARASNRISAAMEGAELGTLQEKEPMNGGTFLFASGEVDFLVHEITISGTIDKRSAWYQGKKTNWVTREIVGVLGN